jgi:DNA-binding transcriptional MerR regulator
MKTAGAGVAVKLIGTCEAARILGVHRNTIGHWAQNGILRARVLPTGARRFTSDDVERVRARIHRQSHHDAPQLADPMLGDGASPADLDKGRRSTIDRGDHQILVRVDRGGILIGEAELRYQLQRKDDHPLAQADELLDVLAEIEARGLIDAELCFRLTPEGRARLAEPDTSGRAER